MVFRSDADAALLTRNPEALARPLEKLGAGSNAALPASQATAHLYVVNPQLGPSWVGGILDVHPPLVERVRLLVRMSPGASLEKLQEAAQAGALFGAAAGLSPEKPAGPAVTRLVVQARRMLPHAPQPSKLSQEFTISEGEPPLTELEINASRYRGTWTMGLERREVYGDWGWLGLKREYYLKANGEIKGRADKSSFRLTSHIVRFGGQTYILEKEFAFFGQFTLRAGDRSLGAIYREGAEAMNIVAELPEVMPVPWKIFLICLALFWWYGTPAGTSARGKRHGTAT